MNLFLLFFSLLVIVQRLYEMKSHQSEKGEVSSAGTLRAMAAAHGFCFVAAPVEMLLRESSGEGMVVLGFVVFIAGFILRRWVIHTLGRYWSVHIEIRDAQPLIAWGPYSWCRHPNYLAILLEVCGYCIVFSAWVTAGLTLLMYLPALRKRILCEEEVLNRCFGYRYQEYSRRVPALLPWLSKREPVH